ncbi:hypothetical protein [Yersinia aleksiciae]|uniref:hypothetical protein n=1 Tax=Yersinia aleksiciae TaxID=263819 RepID=UPI00119F2185|nr:hypothetical protein [Yersinia aleksiciae]
MPILKCTKDEMGYWTVGETYTADHAGGGMLSLGDDDDPEAEWILIPLTYADDENNTATYVLAGVDGQAEFEELVEGNADAE